jgi:homopolymeric O-antigen transport system ATP-binding protein
LVSGRRRASRQCGANAPIPGRGLALSRPAILVERLSKRFLIGARVNHADTLGETLATTAARQLLKLRDAATSRPRVVRDNSEEFWALRDVSFEVQRGEVLGIVGRNGSGKTTLLKILSRITSPTEGEATIVGRIGTLLEVGTGFHGELTGRENVYLSGTILGMKRREIAERFDEIVEFSGVERFIETPVKHYSSGMYLRLAFAVAAHLRTEILLVDEVLAVGDAAFQKKCIEKMSEVAREGRTVLFVSHNLPAVASLCSAGLLLNGGRIERRGSIDETVSAYNRLLAATADDDATGHAGVTVSRPRLMSGEGPVDSSKPMGFQFTLSVSRLYWNIFVQVGLLTHEGTSILLEGVDSERFPELRGPGRYRFDVELPALWLRPRSYAARIKVIAYPDSGTTERFYSEWVDITVAGGVGVEVAQDRLLAPLTRWSVQPEEPRAAPAMIPPGERTDRW